MARVENSGRPTAVAGWLVPLSFAVYGVAISVTTVAARYSPASVLALAGIWTLFSLTLYFGARWLQSWGRAGGLAGAFGLCFAALWHLREQTFAPASLLAVPFLAAVAAPLWLLAVERLLAPPRRRRCAALAVLAGLLFAVTFAAAYRGSALLRWHLLRHNTMLGTPGYYLLGTSTAERERELLAARPTGGGELSAPLPPAAGTGPDVVFILLDTLRADALAAWGAERELMPRLDRFLANAWRFTDVVANSSWTRPSMGSFFTGLLPEEHGARDLGDALGEAHPMLAEILRGRGYRTAAFMTNLAALGDGTGFSRGFDLYHQFRAKPYARAAAVNRAVRAWAESVADEPAPLFLYLHYLDPHEPYMSGNAPEAERAEEYLAAYRAELAYLDRELDRLLAFLTDWRARPPLVFIASDHGEEFFEHGLFGHGHSLYQELIHVPAALWAAGAEGADLAAPLEARDFFDLLVRLGSGEEVAVDEWAKQRSRHRRYASVYYSQTGRLALRPYLRKTLMRMVAEGDRKLIWSGYGDTRELYDLANDRGEVHNLAAKLAGESSRLAAALDEPIRFWTFSPALRPSGEALDQLRDLGYLD